MKPSILECICSGPGFCPVFRKTMGTNPPDWAWCQKSSPGDRQSYFDLLVKAPPSENMDTFSIIKNAKTKEEAFLYYLTLKNNQYICNLANQNQMKTNKKIVEFIEKEKDECDFSNVEIVCLGHSKKQFDKIQDRPYLKKINLNDLDAGKYSGNEWAESRAFVAKNLFSKDVDFVGFVTASWNDKYESFSRIDNFHNWNTAKILLNSNPEDKIVLCADIFCACWWTTAQYQSSNILSNFFNDKSNTIGNTLLKLVNLDNFSHIKVPFANQMIAHRHTIQQYLDYLENDNILDKVDWFVKKFASKYIDHSNEIKNLYQNHRIQAYLMEMISCFWFANQDFIYVPNVTRKENWYSQKDIKERINYNV
jgi:hypothetical protein